MVVSTQAIVHGTYLIYGLHAKILTTWSNLTHGTQQSINIHIYMYILTYVHTNRQTDRHTHIRYILDE